MFACQANYFIADWRKVTSNRLQTPFAFRRVPPFVSRREKQRPDREKFYQWDTLARFEHVFYCSYFATYFFKQSQCKITLYYFFFCVKIQTYDQSYVLLSDLHFILHEDHYFTVKRMANVKNRALLNHSRYEQDY